MDTVHWRRQTLRRHGGGLHLRGPGHHAGAHRRPRHHWRAGVRMTIVTAARYSHSIRPAMGTPRVSPSSVEGTPPASHEGRWLCRIDPHSLQVERLFPLDWEPRAGTRMSISSGVYVRDGSGDALILGYQRSDGHGLHRDGSLIVRRHVPNGRVLWVASFDAPVTALADMPRHNVVVFVLNDGHLGVISAVTGEVQLLRTVALDGVTSVYLSLAARGNRIAAGTIDGRIVVGDM